MALVVRDHQHAAAGRNVLAAKNANREHRHAEHAEHDAEEIVPETLRQGSLGHGEKREGSKR